MPGWEAPIRIRKDVVFRELEGELVLLNLNTGVYFGLDSVGSAIWRLIDGFRSASEIVTAMTEEYDVDAATCRADLDRFLDALRANDLIDTMDVEIDDGAPR
jgi:hypothetical protein